MINFGVEMRSEKRQQGVPSFANVDQQSSQEQLKEAAVNHSVPGNSLTRANATIQGAQGGWEPAVPCSTWAAASKSRRSEQQTQI